MKLQVTEFSAQNVIYALCFTKKVLNIQVPQVTHIQVDTSYILSAPPSHNQRKIKNNSHPFKENQMFLINSCFYLLEIDTNLSFKKIK